MTGWSDAEMRRKFADVQPEPMFEVAEQKTGEPQKRAPRPRNRYRIECPECRQTVGVIRQHTVTGPAEVIREHTRTTYKGNHRFPCPKGGTEVTGNERTVG